MKTTTEIIVTIRALFTLALIFGVYTETGHWTALSFLFLFLYIEFI